MFKLVLHHNYQEGKLLDISGMENHGFYVQGNHVQGEDKWTNAPYFNGVNNRIIVPPSDSLRDISAIRIAALLWVEELDQRRNIVEGFLSFALFIQSDGSLKAGIYNGSIWHETYSKKNTIPLQKWVRVKYIYNGYDTSLLYVNNYLVANNYDYLGKVQSVRWPFGLNIGAWPDADKYVFKGKICEIKLWCYSDV